MLSLSITMFSSLLADHLKRAFKLDESIVSLQPLTEQNKAQPSNKIHLFLVNVERETSGGISFNQQALPGGYYKSGAPSWQLNLYIMLAAVFQEKQYEEALRLLSGTLSFLQSNNQFPLPGSPVKLAVEPVNMSFNELSNLWSICGGTYYPSIVCKIRTLNIDEAEIKRMGRIVSGPESAVKKRE